MMLRTEFAKEKRATPSGSPEKPPRGGGERQLPDAVAARLIAVANTKADDAERRVFEMEESTAKRVANICGKFSHHSQHHQAALRLHPQKMPPR
jgi:hypothetical protein